MSCEPSLACFPKQLSCLRASSGSLTLCDACFLHVPSSAEPFVRPVYLLLLSQVKFLAFQGTVIALAPSVTSVQ